MRETSFVFKYGYSTVDVMHGVLMTFQRLYEKPESWWSPKYVDIDRMITDHCKQIRSLDDKKDENVRLNK